MPIRRFVRRRAAQVDSFRRRRIDLPVGADDLVLDVGSGDKPHWRADVLVDRFPTGAPGQRSGSGLVRIDRPLFEADVTDLPFADHAFDYSVCAHVLEHVEDPAAAVAELARVSRAGYVEVPEVGSAKILDHPSHLWWVRLEGKTLVFHAKESRDFDPDIARFVERSGIEGELDAVLDRHFDDRVIALQWIGELDVRVDGEPPRELVDAARDPRPAGQRHHDRLARGLTWAFTARRPDRRRRPVRHDDVVAPSLRCGTDEVLRAQIYHSASTDRSGAPDRAR